MSKIFIERELTRSIQKRLSNNPAVALLGPRQCGKTSLAKHLISAIEGSYYLDLENPRDLARLSDPLLFFEEHKGQLVCLDEIQRIPEIFSTLRSVIDEVGENGQFLILGSASPDLIQQSSESLAGRLSYLELTPFLWNEVASTTQKSEETIGIPSLLLKGGFPRSYLLDNESSFQWRTDFLRSFLERDLPQFGFRIPAMMLRRFWKMVAHLHGETLNYSKIGNSLGVTYHTIRHYVDILEQTFMLRVLPPYEVNLKKRLIKSPKVYVRDSGLLMALLDIETVDELLGHPVFGAAWEGFVIENILSFFPNWQASFYRTSSGTELDLILTRKNRVIAVECKASTAPKVSKGFWNAIADIQPEMTWIIAPVSGSYLLKENVRVGGMKDIIDYLA